MDDYEKERIEVGKNPSPERLEELVQPLESLNSLARGLTDQGNFGKAEPLWSKIIADIHYIIVLARALKKKNVSREFQDMVIPVQEMRIDFYMKWSAQLQKLALDVFYKDYIGDGEKAINQALEKAEKASYLADEINNSPKIKEIDIECKKINGIITSIPSRTNLSNSNKKLELAKNLFKNDPLNPQVQQWLGELVGEYEEIVAGLNKLIKYFSLDELKTRVEKTLQDTIQIKAEYGDKTLTLQLQKSLQFAEFKVAEARKTADANDLDASLSFLNEALKLYKEVERTAPLPNERDRATSGIQTVTQLQREFKSKGKFRLDAGKKFEQFMRTFAGLWDSAKESVKNEDYQGSIKSFDKAADALRQAKEYLETLNDKAISNSFREKEKNFAPERVNAYKHWSNEIFKSGEEEFQDKRFTAAGKIYSKAMETLQATRAIAGEVGDPAIIKQLDQEIAETEKRQAILPTEDLIDQAEKKGEEGKIAFDEKDFKLSCSNYDEALVFLEQINPHMKAVKDPTSISKIQERQLTLKKMRLLAYQEWSKGLTESGNSDFDARRFSQATKSLAKALEVCQATYTTAKELSEEEIAEKIEKIIESTKSKITLSPIEELLDKADKKAEEAKQAFVTKDLKNACTNYDLAIGLMDEIDRFIKSINDEPYVAKIHEKLKGLKKLRLATYQAYSNEITAHSIDEYKNENYDQASNLFVKCLETLQSTSQFAEELGEKEIVSKIDQKVDDIKRSTYVLPVLDLIAQARSKIQNAAPMLSSNSAKAVGIISESVNLISAAFDMAREKNINEYNLRDSLKKALAPVNLEKIPQQIAAIQESQWKKYFVKADVNDVISKIKSISEKMSNLDKISDREEKIKQEKKGSTLFFMSAMASWVSIQKFVENFSDFLNFGTQIVKKSTQEKRDLTKDEIWELNIPVAIIDSLMENLKVDIKEDYVPGMSHDELHYYNDLTKKVSTLLLNPKDITMANFVTQYDMDFLDAKALVGLIRYVTRVDISTEKSWKSLNLENLFKREELDNIASILVKEIKDKKESIDVLSLAAKLKYGILEIVAGLYYYQVNTQSQATLTPDWFQNNSISALYHYDEISLQVIKYLTDVKGNAPIEELVQALNINLLEIKQVLSFINFLRENDNFKFDYNRIDKNQLDQIDNLACRLIKEKVTNLDFNTICYKVGKGCFNIRLALSYYDFVNQDLKGQEFAKMEANQIAGHDEKLSTICGYLDEKKLDLGIPVLVELLGYNYWDAIFYVNYFNWVVSGSQKNAWPANDIEQLARTVYKKSKELGIKGRITLKIFKIYKELATPPPPLAKVWNGICFLKENVLKERVADERVNAPNPIFLSKM